MHSVFVHLLYVHLPTIGPEPASEMPTEVIRAKLSVGLVYGLPCSPSRDIHNRLGESDRVAVGQKWRCKPDDTPCTLPTALRLKAQL